MPDEKQITETIIGMESAALRRWGNGDPSGFLEICAPDIVYFDPYQEKRIDGIEALRECYKGIWGQVHFDRFERSIPVCRSVANWLCSPSITPLILATNETHGTALRSIALTSDGWRCIQTHWSIHVTLVSSEVNSQWRKHAN